MKKRILSLCLAGTLFLSMSVTASAARVSDSSAPKSATSHEWAVTPVSSSLSFDQIGAKVRANNLTVKSLEETIESMEAMDWDEIIDDMEDAIDDVEDGIAILNSSMVSVKTATQNLAASLSKINGVLSSEQIKDLTGNIVSVSYAIYGESQLSSLESSLESLEDQLDDLKEQKSDYINKTLPDTKRQLASTVDQIVIGAESLYMTILSTELQKDSLDDTTAAMERTVAEMELRYARGQISQLTLTQVKNGYNTLLANVDSLEMALVSMKTSLQSLLGETITGQVTLMDLPTISSSDLSGISYTEDLAKAKEASYDLYSAARTVEDAEDDMEDARREEGKNSYQYKMAQHTYEAALLTERSAIQSFELSFQSLYNQLAPAQAALLTAESDLAYEEQVYQVARLKYQQGNLSANALADAKDTYETAKRDYTSAQMDLFTAYHNYQNAVEYGIVSSGA